MYRIRVCAVAVAISGLFTSVPSTAQTVTVAVPGTPTETGKAQNPNELICEKQETTGSRLAKRRVCMTRSQWADLRLQDRQEIEKVQVQRGMKGE